jgi:hypothetical protein
LGHGNLGDQALKRDAYQKLGSIGNAFAVSSELRMVRPSPPSQPVL